MGRQDDNRVFLLCGLRKLVPGGPCPPWPCVSPLLPCYDKILADILHTSVRSDVTAPIATAARKIRWDRHIQWWNFKRCHSFCLLLRHVSSLRCFSPFPTRSNADCNPRWSRHFTIFFFALSSWPPFSFGSFYVVLVLVRVLVNLLLLIRSSSKPSALFWILRQRPAIISCLVFSFCRPLRSWDVKFASLFINLLLLVYFESEQISEILLHKFFSKTCDGY